MVLFPRDLVRADAAEEFHDVLAPVVTRLAGGRETHEDDGHAGEESHEGAAGLCGCDGLCGDARVDVDEGERDALLDDDGAFDGHG